MMESVLVTNGPLTCESEEDSEEIYPRLKASPAAMQHNGENDCQDTIGDDHYAKCSGKHPLANSGSQGH